jgi:hypothetical protein
VVVVPLAKIGCPPERQKKGEGYRKLYPVRMARGVGVSIWKGAGKRLGVEGRER